MMYILLAFMSVASLAHSQDLMGFDRSNYGSVVLSQTQSVGSDVQLELSIGNYENEPIINYSPGSVFAQIGRSVGRLDVLTDKGVFPCTAFIVSEKHILTNYHCSKGLLDNEKIGASRIDATQFVAGYTQTGIEEGTKKYTVIPTPVEASKTLDYAVLEVIGDPSQEYGQLKLASTSPAGGDPFWIIGHPMGEGQRISREKCKANNPALSSGKLLHTCDTLPGNSGSPVIDAGLQQVVALHHAGSKADSVNFAILMSEILANSKVLTAYKAPISVQQVAPKTAEITACDALYSAAAEAKACFAYEAYFKSCRSHSLAPIAEGYISEFCQFQEVEKASIKTCSKDPKLCGNELVCVLATTNGVPGYIERRYVKEAKRRGLSCGVSEAQKSSVKKECSASNVNGCSAAELCKNSTVPTGNTRVWKTFVSVFKTEAMRRGLSCSVSDAQKPSVKKECSASNVDGCSAAELCKNSTVPNGNTRVWKTFVSVFKTEAIRRGYDCDVGQVNAYNIKQAFISQSKLKRRQLQYALKKLGYYSYGIDGLWGKGTSSGLDKFVKRNGLKGKTEAQVFSSLLSKVSVPSSFKQKPIILGKNWALGLVCSGTLASGKALFYNRNDLEYETRYTISWIDNFGEIHKGLLKITGTKMRFRMESARKKIVTTGSGKFNSSYSRAEGKASGNCHFYAVKN